MQLVVGVSGSGKTAWASNAALSDPAPTAYFDVGELPGQAVATSLARELVARFLVGREFGSGGAALPAASGNELMALLSRSLKEAELEVTVVLDNVHRLSADTLRTLTEVAPNIRFVLLAQPWPGQGIAETRLNIQADALGGWSADDVAAVFSAEGCPIDVTGAQRLLRLTAGVPLYVNAAARLAARAYDNHIGTFLDTVEGRQAHVQTAQELILADTFDHLNSDARTVAALLDLADVPLDRTEAAELMAAAGLTQIATATAIRELTRSGVVQVIGGGVKLHDAFRLLARDVQTMLRTEIIPAALETLVVLLERSLSTRWTIGRFGLWLRLLPQTGRQETLIDLATQEEFHQVGDPTELRAAIEDVAQSTELDNEARFWALDALAFWDYNAGVQDQVPDAVDRMTFLAHADLIGPAATTLAMKRMIAAALQNDHAGVESAYQICLNQAADNEIVQLIVQYNHALSLLHLGENGPAANEACKLVENYYARLGLELEDVFGANPEDLLAAVPDSVNRNDDFRHTGDCLQLLGVASKRVGQNSVAMAYLHALKFYTAASAWRSAVRVGQDAVDELVELDDFEGARAICENMLVPLARTYQLVDLLVPIRSQYAVVLAWCGDIDGARRSAYDSRQEALGNRVA